MFWQALQRHYRAWANAAGYAPSAVETGAVTGVHRAGASLNVHVHPFGYHEARHFHLLCRDGIYVSDGDALRFVPAPPPTRTELERLVRRIGRRPSFYKPPTVTYSLPPKRCVGPQR